MRMEWFCDVGAVLPFTGMVIETMALASKTVVMKGAFSQGMDKYVLLLYSNSLSSIIFFFCSIIFHSFSGQICGYAGIEYSSATLYAAVLNLIPAFTFILALIFRMEKLEWRRSTSQAKLVGATVSIAGAFVVTLYKGPTMLMKINGSQQSNWILGGFLSAAQALSMSVTYIIEAMVLKKYPAPLLMLLYSFSLRTIVSSIYCVIIVQDSTAWRLKLDMGLLPIFYAGFTTALCLGLILWCLWKTGPLYVSMFKPLGIIFAAVLSIVFLGDVLCLGSLIGAVTIVVGFYMVGYVGKGQREGDGKLGAIQQ